MPASSMARMRKGVNPISKLESSSDKPSEVALRTASFAVQNWKNARRLACPLRRAISSLSLLAKVLRCDIHRVEARLFLFDIYTDGPFPANSCDHQVIRMRDIELDVARRY